MFGKFLRTPECMKILSWLLNHPDDEYSASIVGIECEMSDMNTFMAVLSTLEGAGFISFNSMSDELLMKLNKDESITQLLIHLKDEFNDKAFRSDQVSPSLAYLNSVNIREALDLEIFREIIGEGFLDLCKNYKELDTSDPKNEEIFKLCSKLEETGEYEEFISRLEEAEKE